ncbi:MAG: Do family serine endopeptidase [Bacteroidales bacterium]|jgi:serine protease Do|nr:Do family serine endopeptidase [Bacteroidales bacterium]
MKKIAVYLIPAILGSVFTLAIGYMVYPEVQQYKNDNVKSETTDFAHKVSYTSPASGTELIDFTETASQVMPTVVHIKTETTLRTGAYPPGYDIWQEFFGPHWNMPQQENIQHGAGSGVIVSDDGYIVTNNHVIQQADKIEVVLNNKQSYNAEVIGTDPNTDIALIKISAANLRPIKFANSDNVKVGEWVLAVGNPFNLTSTVTAGIVSAKGRNINILRQKYAIESFIQTDAAINPGNSGGALTNMHGDLVGINTAIASPTGSYSGYGFAVPANIVTKVIYDLKKYGLVQRGFIGVSIRDVDSKLIKEKDLAVSEGVFIADLLEKGAAAKAGLKKEDVIIEIDEIAVNSTSELQEIIGRRSPGDVVAVKINRNGTEKLIDVTLTNKDGNTTLTEKSESDGMVAQLGISLKEVDSAVLSELNISNGIQVKEIADGLIRKHTTMRDGFIITKLNNSNISDVEQFTELMKKQNGGILIEGVYPDVPGTFYYAFGM